jgi:hypothetical protein
MTPLIRELLRRHRGTLVIILFAMLVEKSRASPIRWRWPQERVEPRSPTIVS